MVDRIKLKIALFCLVTHINFRRKLFPPCLGNFTINRCVAIIILLNNNLIFAYYCVYILSSPLLRNF